MILHYTFVCMVVFGVVVEKITQKNVANDRLIEKKQTIKKSGIKRENEDNKNHI